VDSDDRVDCLDGLSSWDLDFASSGEGLIESCVDCVEGFEVFLVWPRQGGVKGVSTISSGLANLEMNIPRGPEGIIANFGSKVELEDGSPWRLDLVGYVRMEELSSGKGIRIRSSKSVRVDHYWSALPGFIGEYSPTTSSRSPRRGTAYVACLWRGPK